MIYGVGGYCVNHTFLTPEWSTKDGPSSSSTITPKSLSILNLWISFGFIQFHDACFEAKFVSESIPDVPADSPCSGVVVRRGGMAAQASSSSLDHGSKL
ncbi:hypothetical protein TNCV_2676691 [Trichonephila clavipes]|nr:hypothetical protein TNCV_2676691 [Trichonephila clavipes]